MKEASEKEAGERGPGAPSQRQVWGTEGGGYPSLPVPPTSGQEDGLAWDTTVRHRIAPLNERRKNHLKAPESSGGPLELHPVLTGKQRRQRLP